MKKTFLKRPYIYSLIILVIIIGSVFAILNGKNSTLETIKITKTTFKRQVSVSGKVVAAQSVDLGFEQGGKIASINTPVGTKVTKGTVIASLDNADIRAELLQKQAALEKEQAKLTSIIQGTRPEQLAIYKQTYNDSTRALVTAMRSAQLNTEYALLNQSDAVFSNGSGVNPTITIRTQSESEKRSIENSRLVSTEKNNSWKDSLSNLSESSEIAALNKAKSISDDTLLFVKSFIDELSGIAGRLSTGNSGLTQTQIDSYRSSINAAGQKISTAIETVQSAEASWSNAKESLTLYSASATQSDIDAQRASVRAAEADVENARAKLQKTLITATFDGTVTRMDIKVGEIISSNSTKISLMSTDAFNIESYVPEVHIANIKPGNTAKVTLDAYGEDSIFGAVVQSVDPAETIRDGVSTYKVTLSFDQYDPRIKSGMTGSVNIITLEKPSAIVIPQSVIIKRDGYSYVSKLVNGNPVEVLVETGDSTSLGQIEIVSGLSEGDSVILKP